MVAGIVGTPAVTMVAGVATTVLVHAVTTALADGTATMVGLATGLATIIGLLGMAVVAETIGTVLTTEVATAGAVVEAKVVNCVIVFNSELPAATVAVGAAITEEVSKVVAVTVGLALRQDGE